MVAIALNGAITTTSQDVETLAGEHPCLARSFIRGQVSLYWRGNRGPEMHSGILIWLVRKYGI